MVDSWKDDNCQNIRSLYSVYSVPEAAARWCGVPDEHLEEVLSEVAQIAESGKGRGIYRHPSIPCIEPRSRAIAQAIDSSALPCGREDGEPVGTNDHVAYERRHIRGKDLKEWMQKELPNEKPEFLFDDVDRQKDIGITTDDYLVLKAKYEACEERLNNAVEWYKDSKAVSTQGHNYYQQVIKTMAEVILDSPLSGVPLTDAKNLINAIEKKGKALPDAKTIAKYLTPR
jgi:hypothetical protein